MKNFRLLLLCVGLLFLDMPSPFSACRDNRTGLEVNVQVVDNDNISFNSSEVKLNTQTTNIEQALVEKCIKGSLNTGTIYVEDDAKRYEIEVTSYNIETIVLTKNDRTEIEITLPYDFAEEDIIVYDTGKRNFIRLVVNITVEYEIIIPEVQPE